MTPADVAKEVLEHYGLEKEKHQDLAAVKEVLAQIYSDLKDARLSSRGFKLMARKLMKHDSSHWEYTLDSGRYERAAAMAECDDCGQFYADHPQIEDYPTFHALCDGRIVKL